MKLQRLQAIKLNTKSLGRVVADERGIYVGSRYTKVLALEPEDYRVRWEMRSRGFSPVSAHGETVVLSSDGADLRGVDARTGTTRWTRKGSGWHSQACVPWRGGLLRCPVDDEAGSLVSLDPETGSIVEEIVLGSWAAVLGDGHALITVGATAGRCLDLRDRSVLWERPVFDVAADAGEVPPEPGTHPIVRFHAPGTIVIQMGCRGLAAVALQTGETLWTAGLPVDAVASISVDLGCVVAATAHEMIAFDVGDGSVRWIRPRRDPPPGHLPRFEPPRQAFEGLFLSNEQDGLYLIDPASGADVASAPGLTFGGVAAIGDRLVAVRHEGRVNVFTLDRTRAAPRARKAPSVLRARGGSLAFEEVARVELPGLLRPLRVTSTAEAVCVWDGERGRVEVARDGWRVGSWQPRGPREIAEERRAIASDVEIALDQRARLDDGPFAGQVIGRTPEWRVLWHWSPSSHGSDLRGVSAQTGAVAWHARLEGHDTPFFDGHHVWAPIAKPGFECVDVRTGTVTRRYAPTVVLLRRVGSYGPYCVSAATRKLDFYHPDQETQRLHLDHDVQVVAGAPPELLLVTPEELRVLREAPPAGRRADR